jgi:hypothetical protein
MTYELWDRRSRNMIAHWGDVATASGDLSDFARIHGQDALDDFFLVHEDDDEESHLVAEGQAILVAVKRLSAEEAVDSPARRAV